MVFSRKVDDNLVKPSPPNVEQILEDLKSADPEDPVFTLNPDILNQAESSESDSDKNYKSVLAYVAQEKKITKLQDKISQDFDTLVGAQKELESVSTEVASQLDNIKKERASITKNS